MASLKVTCERMEFNNFYQEIQHFAHIQGILINLPEVNLLCHKIANHSLIDMTQDSQEDSGSSLNLGSDEIQNDTSDIDGLGCAE